MRTKLHALLALVAAVSLIMTPMAEMATAAPSDTVTLELCTTLKYGQITGNVYRRGDVVTVDVANYKIFDLRGAPRTDIVIKTASGVQRIKWSRIQSMEMTSHAKLYDYNSRLASATYTVHANVYLTDGSVLKDAVINAHWGVVEGDTDLGKFFMGDPLTVASITFNRG